MERSWIKANQERTPGGDNVQDAIASLLQLKSHVHHSWDGGLLKQLTEQRVPSVQWTHSRDGEPGFSR